MTPDARAFALSLISHTNVGKTTLARTLLRRDIGEVRDEAHVTLEATRYTLIESAAGDRLELWDTPGLGDSVRLARRLEQLSNPIGWFLSEVWDRFRDRAFWSSQRAIRNILDEADVVLYLANASEAPQDVGYLDAELRVLGLLDKPVIVLLNQMGPPQPAAREAAEIARWRERTQAAPCVCAVLALDAFARCWVQEDTLLGAVDEVLPPMARPAFARLRGAWQARNRTTWQQAMQVLAQRLARAAVDRETVKADGWRGRLKEIGAVLGLRREGSLTPREDAMQALAERLDLDIRMTTDRLIQLHGLEGAATGVVLARLAEHYAVREPVSEGKAAIWGGVVTGALAGLKADLVTGGLTLGGGLLAGGVLGALGAAGLARGYNLVRGVEAPRLMWSDAVLDQLVRSALLGYLAVAHFGRGRGNWTPSEHPDFWQEHVDGVVDANRDTLEAVFKRRVALADRAGDGTDRDEEQGKGGVGRLATELHAWMQRAAQQLLVQLYPDAKDALRSGSDRAP
jgi:50S ribosome-binding GTPase/Domain of unknown function (DUF3482)